MEKLDATAKELELGEMGFGCMSITGGYGEVMKDADSLALLQGIYDAGCRHFDTAEVYKTGDMCDLSNPDDIYNEVVVGSFLKSVPRDSFTVATKYWPDAHEGQCEYQYVKPAVEASLQRLGLTVIDVYYCHRIPSNEHLHNFMASAKLLVEEGLIKKVGLSEVCGSWLREAYQVHPVHCVQQEWSLATRSLEAELAPVCAELGITIVAYSPLCRGLLAVPDVKPTDEFRSSFPRFSGDNYEANSKMALEVSDIAKDKCVSLPQLSLAWLFQKAIDLNVKVTAIPGTTKLTNAKSNLEALAVKLSPTEMRLLEDVATKVAGQRFPEKPMATRTLESQEATLETPEV